MSFDHLHLNMDDNRQLTDEQAEQIEANPCCIGAAVYGAHRCTCWEPLYDIEQRPVLIADAGQRSEMCADCAYRPDSPERNGDPNQKGSEPGELDRIALRSTFWCHQGIRRVIGYRHPTFGFETTTPGTAYDPPQRSGVPYKADGSPGDRCAGWAARRQQLIPNREREGQP